MSDFHYDLPEELIAQEPLVDRAGSRMLRLNRETGQFEDRYFSEFQTFLQRGDLVVLNNTRVFPARLYGRRAGMHAQAVSERNPASRDFLHGRVEVLLTRQVQEIPNEWQCLVRPGRKIAVGERLFFGEREELSAEVIERGEYGERRLRFSPVDNFFGELEKLGHVPLPPYIARSDAAPDRERYQTVYARERGSVAAPTAGLHFTPEVLDAMNKSGIEMAEITLHVGLGTFQPVHAQVVEEHRLHSEAYVISNEASERIAEARNQGRRIVAIGTTTVRTLEYAAQLGRGEVQAGSGEANLFIYPGYEFRVVDALLTNFHLPQSTLLMLVCAFAGKEKVLRAYQHAVEKRYRFYSYGDCMFLE